MYKELIVKLTEHGVKFDTGLSVQEINKIESTYQILLPESIKTFYQEALPVSRGFYNWRDFRHENVQFIKAAIEKPGLEIIDLANEIDWCDEWGQEPTTPSQRKAIICDLVKKSARLIPIYSHRYTVSAAQAESPVLSICGTDVVYYANDFSTYLEIEFNLKPYINLIEGEFPKIPFWNDLL